MQLSVTGRHVEITDEVKRYAQDKALKLPKYFDRIQAIEIVLGHESGQFSVEFIVNTEGRRLFVAHELGPDTFALIDAAVDKLERQLTRHKERVRNRKHPAAPRGGPLKPRAGATKPRAGRSSRKRGR
ncbi:MAG TPA: ribosome-associated translation inhibitor RaiA [Phycisphaerae bacterium]